MAPRSARAWLVAGSLATAALGCGGGSRADTTPAAGAAGGEAQAGDGGGGSSGRAAGAAGGGARAGGGGGGSGGGGEVVPPEKTDEINRQLSRKRAMMSRCLAIAVDNKELPKNSHGKVTVEIVISPSGTADSVKI